MPPPPVSAAPRLGRETTKGRVPSPSPPPPQPSIQSESLFLPDADEDRKWDPANFDEEEDEMLLWDTGAEKVRIFSSSWVQMLTLLGHLDNEFGAAANKRNSEQECK